MLIVGDLHFDAPAKYEVGGSNLYLDAVTESLNNILQYTAKKGELVLFLGDYFEKKDKIENRVKNRLIDALEAGLKEKLLQYIFVVGNHDINSIGELTIKWLAQYGKLVTQLEIMQFQEVNFCLMPWGQWDIPSDLKGKYIIAGHIPLRGFQFGNGQVDEQDDCYIVEDLLSKFEDAEIIVGHYHNIQQHGKAMSIGSIVSVDFGDLSINKAVARISLQEGKIGIITIENKMKKEIINITSDADFEKLNKDYLDKFVRIDVAMNSVNLERMQEILQQSRMRWVDINLVKGKDKNLSLEESDNSIEGVDEYIKSMIDTQQNKELYKEVISEAL